MVRLLRFSKIVLMGFCVHKYINIIISHKVCIWV